MLGSTAAVIHISVEETMVSSLSQAAAVFVGFVAIGMDLSHIIGVFAPKERGQRFILGLVSIQIRSR